MAAEGLKTRAETCETGVAFKEFSEQKHRITYPYVYSFSHTNIHSSFLPLCSCWPIASCPSSVSTSPPICLAGHGSEGCCFSSRVSELRGCSAFCSPSGSLLRPWSLLSTSSSVFSQSLSFSSASFCPYSASSAGLSKTWSVSPFPFGLYSSHGDRASSPADLRCCLVGGRLLNESRARVCFDEKQQRSRFETSLKKFKSTYIY